MGQASQAALIDDIDDDNPFTAVAAFRALLQARGFGAVEARIALYGAKGWRQAIFVDLLLRSADEENRVELIQIIDQLIERAASVDDLVPVALGAFAFPYSPSRSYEFALELREDIFELLLTDPFLRNDTESTRYIDSILEKTVKRRR